MHMEYFQHSINLILILISLILIKFSITHTSLSIYLINGTYNMTSMRYTFAFTSEFIMQLLIDFNLISEW